MASWDVIIVGGGPAGLSAALVLGRARRQVVLFDDDRPRNAPVRNTHGFFTRDGESPVELRRIARAQLRPYGVKVIDAKVTDARTVRDGFEVTLASGARHRARRLLLATGLRDVLPSPAGFEEFFGAGVYHCPYCDGWEVREKRLAAYGRGRDGAQEALALKQWSQDVTLLTDGRPRLADDLCRALARSRVVIEPRRIARLEGDQGGLRRVVFEDGASVLCDAIFWKARPVQRTDLAERLGLSLTHRGTVKSGQLQTTNVPGIFVAGDAARDVQQISVAAAEGTKAAIAINKSLTKDERKPSRKR